MVRGSLDTPRSVSFRSAVKFAALSVLLVAAPFAWVPTTLAKTRTLVAIGQPLLAVLYVLAVLAGIASTVGVPFVRSAAVRCPLVLLFLAGFGADYIARSVLGQSLSSQLIATLLQARQLYGNVFSAFGPQILSGLAIVICVAPALLARPDDHVSIGPWFSAVPLMAGVLTTLILVNLTGRLEEFPPSIAFPIQVYAAARENLVYAGNREAVEYNGRPQPRFQKIVVVLDEGVRGDFLQINNSTYHNTPFLASTLPALANFGLATSFANCSATSRVLLRSGARRSEFPDPEQRILRQPTIWQFAKHAGYRTVNIDAWEPRHPMGNMLTYDELRYIDDREGVPLSPYWQVDDRIADQLVQELSKPGPVLILAEKAGLHFPYDLNVPPDPAFQPRPSVIPRGEHADDVRDYLIGVWSRVDRFFERIIPAVANRPDVLLVYTSDHGQAMYEGGYDATSCSGQNAVKGEGLVPLFVYTGDRQVQREFQAAAARARNRAEQSDIFPTLLRAMGYEPERVDPPYVGGLRHIPDGPRHRRFLVFSPFTSAVHWVNVD